MRFALAFGGVAVEPRVIRAVGVAARARALGRVGRARRGAAHVAVAPHVLRDEQEDLVEVAERVEREARAVDDRDSTRRLRARP